MLKFRGSIGFRVFSGSYHPINNDFRWWSHLISYPKVRSSGIEAEQKFGRGEGKFMEVCSLDFDMILGKTLSFWHKKMICTDTIWIRFETNSGRFTPCMSWKSRQATQSHFAPTQVLADSSKQIQIYPNLTSNLNLNQSFLSASIYPVAIFAMGNNLQTNIYFFPQRHPKRFTNSRPPVHWAPPATATRCLLWAPVGMNHSSQSWGDRAGWNGRQQDTTPLGKTVWFVVAIPFLGEKEHCGGCLLCDFFVFIFGNHIQL